MCYTAVRKLELAHAHSDAFAGREHGVSFLRMQEFPEIAAWVNLGSLCDRNVRPLDLVIRLHVLACDGCFGSVGFGAVFHVSDLSWTTK